VIPRVAALCAIEAAIVLLLAIEVFGAAAAPPGSLSMPVAAVVGDAAPAIGSAAAAVPTPKGTPTTIPGEAARDAVAAKWREDDPVGAVLVGSVKFGDGRPAEGIYVSIEIDGQWRGGTTAANGGYAMVGLRPGTWPCTLRGTGVAETTVDVTIGDDAVQRRDFVVDASIPLRVSIVTADGADGTSALRKAMPGFGAFAAVGMRDPVPERLPPTDYGVVFVGNARWQPEMNPRDGFAGTLHCASLPAHVALMQRHLVVQQQLVQPGATEVKFVVDIEALRGLAGSATVRVLDAASGAPLVDASVSLHTSNRGGGGQKVDAEGRALLEGLSPGYLRCQISAKDREMFYTTVRVEPGQRLDLGDVRLGALDPMRGTVLDLGGKPATADLSWIELKWRTGPTEFATNRVARTEADGTFSLWGTGHGTIAVSARDSDGNVARGVFDHPSPNPIVLRLGKPAVCMVTRPPDPTRSFTITFHDDQQRPVASQKLEPRVTKLPISLPPGDYGFEVHDEQYRLVQSGRVTLGASPTAVEVR